MEKTIDISHNTGTIFFKVKIKFVCIIFKFPKTILKLLIKYIIYHPMELDRYSR